MKLILFRGPPGSSKSTSAAKMFPGIVKFENDQYFMKDGKYCWSKKELPKAIAWCATMVETALKNGMDVVVANTFTKCKYIDFYRKLAETYSAKFKVYRCTAHFKNVHGLAPALVKKFENAMEDWPGEVIVQPCNFQEMTHEVFDLSTGEIYGKFPSLREADTFIAGLAGTELESQVQIRPCKI